MKPFLLLSFFLLLISGTIAAQSPPYRVVFDLTSRDSLDHKAVIRWIREISRPNPKMQVEVVMYAKGLEMVMPEKSVVTEDLKELMQNANFSFKVCEIAMKNNKVEKSQMIPGVQTVPDGIY
ncbi:MAG TPA: hypothetical protein VGR15_09915, partial [Bacteroidota bacterium]|nr:hypothetical protein [Bacteroidota bacterium]